ncbi:Probable alpha-galactosidase B; AltName: Full=Melibiase B; Flags: Precursor [Serendipita indica DSM 11827]|uniref:Alpha-galactosidase n=1 Tax=Serendipita indica (strain DSM 11827) TaxID=1109443 RepID=G4TT10_SERID|nr:Probable alpha-galactosidase B; AltName: Full=Melibiase B; Flags: Precursor [Serendipita indica DSM 11827]CCA74446.1 related to alpha-galactosidase precursor [Serendipita indica DSM 11827]
MSFKAIIALSVLGLVGAQQTLWGQCGGINWTGQTSCGSGAVCTYLNDWYYQCLPGTSTSSRTSTSTSSTRASTSNTSSTRVSTTSTSSTRVSTTSTTSTRVSTTTSSPSSTPTGRVGKLPALGWNSWNAYRCDINETKLLNAANQMVSLGLKAAGYQYVNIDDCWSNINGRDPSTQQILPDLNKFPNGMASVASKIHSLGLLLGIYSDAGTKTCSGYPGSLGYEAIDAATFSSWGIDYLKYDNCNVPSEWQDNWTYPDWGQSNSAIRYRQMGTALAAQSRPIQYSLCIWGAAQVWTWGASVGQSWRISGDSAPTWSYITSVIDRNVAIIDYTNFYGRSDMDMMEIGNGDLTLAEERTHFLMWAALKSPILLGTDLSLLSTDQLNIIKNKELLAFSQDELVGAPAKPYGTATTTPPEYYSGKSSKGVHVFIMNTSSSTSTKTITFANVPGLGSGSYKVHDMWTGTDVGTFSGSWSTSLGSHDSGGWLITPA